MSSQPSPPQPVNPVTLANAQGTANTDTAIANAYLNNRTNVTPFGTTSTSPTGTQTVGTGTNARQVPTFTSTTTLDPKLQADVTGLLNASNTAMSEIHPTPLTMPSVPNPQLLDQSTSDAVYNQAASRLDPQWARQENEFKDQLTSQGLQPGDKAYDNAYADFQRSKTDAYQTAKNNATAQGAAISGQLFGEGITGNQQNISQQKEAQTFPINELSAILQGQGALPSPGSPISYPSNIAPTDVTGAYGLAQSGAQNLYNTQAGIYGQNLGGIAGLAGQGLLAASLLSDRRLKQDLRRLGELPSGIPIYSFQYVWGGSRFVGVMAQDVLSVNPDAVATGDDGFYRVNYSMLGIEMTLEA